MGLNQPGHEKRHYETEGGYYTKIHYSSQRIRFLKKEAQSTLAETIPNIADEQRLFIVQHTMINFSRSMGRFIPGPIPGPLQT